MAKKENAVSRTRRSPSGFTRRHAVGIAAVGALVFSLLATLFSSLSTAPEMVARIGLVLAALWLAWPSLLRPARWLPPGAAVLLLGGVLAIAVQPRLVFAVAPLIGGLVTFGWVAKWFRSNRN